MVLDVCQMNVRVSEKVTYYSNVDRHKGYIAAKDTLVLIYDCDASLTQMKALMMPYVKSYNVFLYPLRPKSDLLQMTLNFQAWLNLLNLQHITLISKGYAALIAQMVSQYEYERIQRLIMIHAWRWKKMRSSLWFRMFSRIIKSSALLRYYDAIPVGDIDDGVVHQPTLSLLPTAKDGLELNLEAIAALHAKIDVFMHQIRYDAFRNLVLEGAGVRGAAYCGALMALNALGVLKNIKRVSGVSAGAIYALFWAIGYDIEEIQKIALTFDYTTFVDSHKNIIMRSARFLRQFGWHEGKNFYETIGNMVQTKLGRSDITFAELAEVSHVELYIIGTNLSYGKPEVYSAEHTPDMQLRDALRITMSIPMYYTTVRRKQENGLEDILVDGGLSWNYPIELFDDEKYLDNPINGRKIAVNDYNDEISDARISTRCLNYETLGFRLDPGQDPLEHYRAGHEYIKIGNVFEFAKAFMRLYSAATLKRYLIPEHWNRTIFVDTLDIDSTNFSITEKDLCRLLSEGKKGVYRHFDWRMGPGGLKYPQ